MFGQAFTYWLVCGLALAAFSPDLKAAGAAVAPTGKRQTFIVRGTVKQIRPDGRTVVIKHEEIPDYMDAMTMPFKVQATNELAGLGSGDEITFRLHVEEEESWIDQVKKTGRRTAFTPDPAASPAPESVKPTHPLMSYRFTNELGQTVSLADFKGQALAITFFFTRCPIPDYCPRLSRNFEEASQKLAAIPGAPTNWHFLSFTIDPAFDTPAMLKAYGLRYHYDPSRWSFLTGHPDRIKELAGQSQVTYEQEGGLYNHNFRTLVIDAAGKLQISFPIGGNLADALVEEILKAARATAANP